MNVRNDAIAGNRRKRQVIQDLKKIDGVLGEYKRDDIVPLLNANANLVARFRHLLSKPITTLERRLLDTEQGYQFTRQNLPQLIDNLAVCATEFADGKPCYVCNHPTLCAFCAHTRSRYYYKYFLKHSYARLNNVKQIDFVRGVIRPEMTTTVEDIPLVLERLRGAVNRLRKMRFRKMSFYAGRVSHNEAVMRAIAQFDTFLHFSQWNKGAQEIYITPHLHVLVSKYAFSNGIEDIHAHLQDAADYFGLEYKPHATLHVRKQRKAETDYLPYSVARYAQYCSIMLKPTMDAKAKLHALMAIPKHTRQITRMKGHAIIKPQAPKLSRKEPQVIYRAQYRPESDRYTGRFYLAQAPCAAAPLGDSG